MTSSIERSVSYAVLVAAACFAVLPLLVVLVTALQPDRIGSDAGLTLANFRAAWVEGGFSTYMRTSVVVSLCVVVLATALATLAGFAFGTMRFPGADVLFYVFLLGLMVPSEAVIVPLYFDLRSLQLTDSYVALVLPQVAQSLAFGTFWMRAYFRSTSREVVEAARLDGANTWQVLWLILLPMGRPAVLTMTLLVFMWTWNEFLVPLVMVTDEGLRTAPLGLANFQGQYTSGTALLAAGAVLVALPVVLVYLCTQRYFIRGMIDGAVKG